MNQNIVNISARALKNKQRKDGYIPVTIFLRKGSEQKQYPSGMKSLPEHFDNEKGEFKGPKGDVIKLNAKLRNKINYIDEIVFELDDEGYDFTLSHLIRKLDNPKLTYFKEFADRALQKEGKRVAYKTWLYNRERLDAIHKMFPDLKLSEINVQILNEIKSNFEIRGLKKSTLNRTYAVLKKYIRIAKAEGLIKKNPFDQFKIGADNKSEIQWLDQDEIDMIENNTHLYTKSEMGTFIHFLHSCYTGLRGVDSRVFDIDKHSKDGFLVMNMAKTGLEVRVPLNDTARRLNPWMKDATLKVKANKITQDLKGIMAKCGINKHITFNCARHSFAINSLIKGVPIEVVSSWLGHTSLKTTQIYAKVVDSLSKSEMQKWNTQSKDWLKIGFVKTNDGHEIKMTIDGKEVYLPKKHVSEEAAKRFVLDHILNTYL